MAEKELYTTAEAAEYLGFSPVTLKTARSTGQLSGLKAPKFRRIGKKSVRYHIDSLRAWVAESNDLDVSSDADLKTSKADPEAAPVADTQVGEPPDVWLDDEYDD